MRKVRTPEPEGFAEFWEKGKLPPQTYLLECFDYFAETGDLVWRRRPQSHFQAGKHSRGHHQRAWNAKYAGKPACARTPQGYLRTSINKRSFYAHRIIWKLVHGVEPSTIDHINGDRADNRIENLRSVSQAQNARNMKPRSSGPPGVYRHSAVEGWYAQVPINGRVRSKLFKTEEEALSWRLRVGREEGFTDRHLGIDR